MTGLVQLHGIDGTEQMRALNRRESLRSDSKFKILTGLFYKAAHTATNKLQIFFTAGRSVEIQKVWFLR